MYLVLKMVFFHCHVGFQGCKYLNFHLFGVPQNLVAFESWNSPNFLHGDVCVCVLWVHKIRETSDWTRKVGMFCFKSSLSTNVGSATYFDNIFLCEVLGDLKVFGNLIPKPPQME